jgi:hypothetical protein
MPTVLSAFKSIFGLEGDDNSIGLGSSIEVKRGIYHAAIVKARFEREGRHFF